MPAASCSLPRRPRLRDHIPVVFDYDEDISGLNLPVGSQASIAIYTDRRPCPVDPPQDHPADPQPGRTTCSDSVPLFRSLASVAAQARRGGELLPTDPVRLIPMSRHEPHGCRSLCTPRRNRQQRRSQLQPVLAHRDGRGVAVLRPRGRREALAHRRPRPGREPDVPLLAHFRAGSEAGADLRLPGAGAERSSEGIAVRLRPRCSSIRTAAAWLHRRATRPRPLAGPATMPRPR